jgi:hypothetical protein
VWLSRALLATDGADGALAATRLLALAAARARPSASADDDPGPDEGDAAARLTWGLAAGLLLEAPALGAVLSAAAAPGALAFALGCAASTGPQLAPDDVAPVVAAVLADVSAPMAARVDRALVLCVAAGVRPPEREWRALGRAVADAGCADEAELAECAGGPLFWARPTVRAQRRTGPEAAATAARAVAAATGARASPLTALARVRFV